ncbi:hypothetical protein S40285_00538 [Stachybotrys chlorohalonatus IBT 40285]|uniref:Uncharacterized protein n=1 Tax=Stachybotrys chlorohalonatus (strain IBT 40285) TaxID=1283841 RepID=A0A084QN83_STAC4|nr:hypothetical protein S40285_00538 [Stachybotrys chlorohalonata IBT 40285]
MPKPEPDNLGPTEFDSAFVDPSSFFYFHHIVNTQAATLRVEVLGPGLSMTFTHSRAQKLHSPSQITTALDAKTVGFLTLVVPGNAKRTILAWAQSGHGSGSNGDVLDAGRGILSNKVWTRRAVAMARLLGVKMGRPFDQKDRIGYYACSHVEVKLATHAVLSLLKASGIANNMDNVKRAHLQRLRRTVWENSARPEFEVFFSRRQCNGCGFFCRKLGEAAGVSIKLIWRHRLALKQYKEVSLKDPSRLYQTDSSNQQLMEEKIQSRDFDDSMTDDEDDDDAEAVASEDDNVMDLVAIDLTNLPTTPAPPTRSGLVDLTDGPPTPVPTQPWPAPVADDYSHELARRAGQMSQAPEAARAVIVDLAYRKRRQRAITRHVAKPLPPTPKMHDPMGTTTITMTAPDAAAVTPDFSHSQPGAVAPSRDRVAGWQVVDVREDGGELSPSWGTRKTARYSVQIPVVRRAAS